MKLESGLHYTVHMNVVPENTAAYIGSGDMEVLATPALAAIMENAAMLTVSQALNEGETTVGTKLNISHDKATKVGKMVSATAVLKEIDGRRLIFDVVATQNNEVIGSGTHERFIVNREKFLTKLDK